ncbi:hypothetical protein GmHk_06G017299 [Glycine max]|nr:hypothetical protein GmHk_06G017299 [Glycine max]
MADGGWRKAKIPPYKHTIAPYGTTMAGLPSQIAFGGISKIIQDEFQGLRKQDVKQKQRSQDKN